MINLSTLTPISLLVAAFAAHCAWAGQTSVGTLRLEVTPRLAGCALALGAAEGAGASQLQISRLDWLMSGLELQRADGSWLPSAEWTAFFSTSRGLLHADAMGVPAGRYQAVRFRVGLDAATDARSPSDFSNEHPLRAALDTMHWGWSGGFIHLAVEGRAGAQAFSYHLAHAENAPVVTLPVEFEGGGPVTLQLELDAQALLAGIDPALAPSTHSRPGDPTVALLQAGLQRAFTVRSTHTDLFQAPITERLTQSIPGTTAVALRVPERFPRLSLPADNPLTEEGVALGAALFHEVKLSINSTQSCASCHEARRAFTESRATSVGAKGQAGQRNAMALFNLAWHGDMFWDGRARSLRQQVLMPITAANEMGETLPAVVKKLSQDKRYPAAFRRAFGTAEITPALIAKALEQHLLTLTAHDSKFDRAVRKQTTLTPAEARGLQLFVTENDPARGLCGADCFHCHGGMLFTDHAMHNNGLELGTADIGREAVTGQAGDRGKFKTPSLRNIALTAPYMHDGRFSSLEAVIEHYDHGVRRSDTLDPNLAKHPSTGLGLSAQEKADLIAFLHCLTETSLTEPQPQRSEPALTASPTALGPLSQTTTP